MATVARARTVFAIQERSAILSEDRRYRYELRRAWADGPLLNAIMLNPSTADGTDDDPTIRRLLGFAERWGYGALVVTNLFALRSPQPAALRVAPDPVGPFNDAAIRAVAQRADRVLVAWGAWSGLALLGHRDASVLALLHRLPVPTWCLGETAAGQPRHPLYVPGATLPRPYTGPGQAPAGCWDGCTCGDRAAPCAWCREYCVVCEARADT